MISRVRLRRSLSATSRSARRRSSGRFFSVSEAMGHPRVTAMEPLWCLSGYQSRRPITRAHVRSHRYTSDKRIRRCRRKGCGYSKEETGNDPGRCPRCNMRLWAKPLPRHVRFHDVRHTTATLLLKMGVPLVTVQRILRHKDVRLTASTYGHLSIEDMREGLSHFPLGSLDALVPGALTAPPQPATPSRWVPVGRPHSTTKKKAADPEGNPSKISGLRM